MWRIRVLALILGGIFYWPIWLAIPPILIYLFFQPAKHFCPECGSVEVAPLEEFRKSPGIKVSPGATDQELLSKPGEPIKPM